MSKVELSVQGAAYGGWTSVRIVKSMQTLCGTFGMTAVDPWPGKPENWKLSIGDICQVKIAGKVAMTGYIDNIPLSYDDRSHNIEIVGRDKAADLVDCSWVNIKNEWKDVSAYHIISALCLPFDIGLVVEMQARAAIYSKIPLFKANEGDTVFETISRLCSLKSVLAISKGDGFLTITRTGTEKTSGPLVYGENIKRGSRTQDNAERFRTYVVKGQAKGDANKAIADYVQPMGQYEDDTVQRYRPICLIDDNAVTQADCAARAQWESRIRAGRSRSVTYQVQGWVQSDGTPWQINRLVTVDDPMFSLHDQLVLTDIEFIKNQQEGEVANLTLMDPDAFLIIPGQKSATKKVKSGFDPLTMQSQ